MPSCTPDRQGQGKVQDSPSDLQTPATAPLFAVNIGTFKCEPPGSYVMIDSVMQIRLRMTPLCQQPSSQADRIAWHYKERLPKNDSSVQGRLPAECRTALIIFDLAQQRPFSKTED